MRWLQLRFDFDLTAIRLLFKGHCVHSDVIRYSRSHVDLFIYFGRSEAARTEVGVRP